MRVCVLAGMPGAGKEEFVKVAMEGGYQVIRMGDVVRKEARRRGVLSNDHGIGSFAHSERQIHGYDIWARRTIPLVRRESTVIDGCRGLSELDVFKREFEDRIIVIGLHTSPETRFARLLKRGREDAPDTWETFRERDRRELNWGLGGLIVLADIMIVNEGGLDAFKENVREVLSKLISDVPHDVEEP